MDRKRETQPNLPIQRLSENDGARLIINPEEVKTDLISARVYCVQDFIVSINVHRVESNQLRHDGRTLRHIDRVDRLWKPGPVFIDVYDIDKQLEQSL